MRRAILLVMLIALASVPPASATGGVIDSVSINGSGVIGAGPVSVNLTLVGVGGATSSSVNWTITLSNMEGVVIDSDNGNTLVEDGVNVFVETTLGDAPLGYSNLSVLLSGDVGTPGANQYVEWYTIVHRLRPLDISIAQPTITGVDSSGNETGNLTVNDGDHARIDVPVVNDGDVNWTGSVNLSIDGTSLTSQNVSVLGDSTSIVSFLTMALSEGSHTISVSLDGDDDADTSDNSGTMPFSVNPPPLPELTLSLDKIVEPSPGNNTVWNLSASNDGMAVFNGELFCTFEGEEISREAVSIQVNASTIVNVGIQSRPGVLICSHDGSRTITNNSASDTISMNSGIFMSAGSSTPSLLQGPWHVGDEILVSLLLRNEGNIQGTSSLHLEYEGILGDISTNSTIGPIITLDAGKAGEVTHKLTFESPGTHYVNWSIQSMDSAVEENLSGLIQIPVLPAQNIAINLTSLAYSDTGIEVEWDIEFDDGKSRMVELTYGSTLDGINTNLIQQSILIQPGITTGGISLGDVNGEEIFVTIEFDDWTSGLNSQLFKSMIIPDNSIIPQISIESVQPQMPSVNDVVTIHCLLTNSGPGTVPSGTLIITNPSGIELSLSETPSFDTETQTISTSIIWPEGELVSLTAIWVVESYEVDARKSVLSEEISDNKDSIVIPWGGILGGLSLGIFLVLAIRLKSGPKKEKKAKPTNVSQPKEDNEKVEVGCPSCDRRLKVPSTYSGAVRCPECETRFDVKGVENQQPTNEQTKEPEVDEKVEEGLWSSSSDDILGCPKCSRKLKVPYDRRPANARCPACETIFEARKD
ncbi:MAG: hypothetical protein QGI21_01325 [Candidatus Poseidoniaceae archaeon]|nr:hypothetical protein [Candidatus Poseidoniaceae archaeon]